LMNRNTVWNVLCAEKRPVTEIAACVRTARWFGMDNRQSIFLNVWRGAREYCWSVRMFTTIKEFKEEFEHWFCFMGKTAVVWIGTDDAEMTKEEALKIATDHVKGNTTTINIDLALCGGLPPRLRKNTTP